MKRRVILVIFLTILLLVFFMIPKVISGYWLRVITFTFMFAILAQSADLITGWAGYPSLGHVVFFGLGAYCVAVGMNAYKLTFPISLLAGGAICVLFAFIIGLPILRTKGHYFVMATIGVNEALSQIITNLKITGGGMGVTLPIPDIGPGELYNFFYYIMLIILIATVLTTYVISKQRLGFALRAIKSSEVAASVLGVNTTVNKSVAWSISALYAGLAGGTYAYWNTFIEPSQVFDLSISIKIFVMLLLGGSGTVFGPLLGAAVVETLSELTWANFLHYHLGILGLLIVLIVMFVHRGLLRLILDYYGKLKAFLGKRRNVDVPS